jgi:hypothetical protein
VKRGALVALGLACAATWAASPAGADSFAPVALDVQVAPVARLHRPLKIAVAVTADPAALDARVAPLRVRAKLAAVCGATFQHTDGTVLLDARLRPQPSVGEAYAGTVAGQRRPARYGVFSVCAYLEEEGDDRWFASDTDSVVDVSKPCTEAARRYDRTRHALGRGASPADRRRVARLRRAARAACGAGVAL